jgi:hypothetical protein
LKIVLSQTAMKSDPQIPSAIKRAVFMFCELDEPGDEGASQGYQIPSAHIHRSRKRSFYTRWKRHHCPWETGKGRGRQLSRDYSDKFSLNIGSANGILNQQVTIIHFVGYKP